MSTTSELDALAECFGVNLRIEDGPCFPAFAVWCEVDCDGTEDIIGTGETASEAIEAARKQLRHWETYA
jgi:hypothetical protein